MGETEETQGQKSGESTDDSVIMREIYKLKEKKNKIGHSRDQHRYFVHEVLRDLFFDMPLEIITLLIDKGRNDWLLDLWNKVGEEVGQSSSITADGLCCKIRTLDNNTVVPIITLPTPQILPEAYFVALVYRPSSSKRKALTRFITLEYSIDLGDGSPANILCEWKGSDLHANMGYGCEPTLEAFFEAVCRLLQREQKMSKKQKTTFETTSDFGKLIHWMLKKFGIISKDLEPPIDGPGVVELELGPRESLVVRKGLYSFGEWIYALGMVLVFALVTLSSVSYQRFTMFNPMSSEQLERIVLPLHVQTIAEEIDKAQDALFGRTFLLAIFFMVLGYTYGQAAITGATQYFKHYIWFWCLGLLMCGLGCSFYASYAWLHGASYLLFGLAGLCFLYGLRCLSKHRSNVGNWKDIGRDEIL